MKPRAALSSTAIQRRDSRRANADPILPFSDELSQEEIRPPGQMAHVSRAEAPESETMPRPRFSQVNRTQSHESTSSFATAERAESIGAPSDTSDEEATTPPGGDFSNGLVASGSPTSLPEEIPPTEQPFPVQSLFHSQSDPGTSDNEGGPQKQQSHEEGVDQAVASPPYRGATQREISKDSSAHAGVPATPSEVGTDDDRSSENDGRKRRRQMVCIYSAKRHCSKSACHYADLDPFLSSRCKPGTLAATTTFRCKWQLDIHFRWCIFLTTVCGKNRGAAWISMEDSAEMGEMISAGHEVYGQIEWTHGQPIEGRGTITHGICTWSAWCAEQGADFVRSNIQRRPTLEDDSSAGAAKYCTEIPRASSMEPPSSIMDEVFRQMSEERRREEARRGEFKQSSLEL